MEIDTGTLWWIGGALVLGLVEIASLDLVFAMLSGAALVAAGSAAFGASFVVQTLVFAVAAAVLLLVVRPVAIRRLKPAESAQLTGTAAHVGRRALVLDAVTERTGRVKLAGEEWTARSAEASRAFAVGSEVEVVAIDGATAVVGPPTPPDAPSAVPPSPAESS